MNLFDTLGLDERINDAVKALGFETPTPIQQKTIPLLLSKSTDLIGLAQTGTGKTAAFGLPALHKTDFSRKTPQVLIICPTRELCLQIARDLSNFARFIPQASVVAVYGGASLERQISEISRGVQIVVATPGRMVDIINRGKVNLNDVKIVVLDEADEMLNMGFKEDLDTILDQTPEKKNTWLFSATMPNEVRSIARNYMVQPEEVSTGKQNQSAENIEHVCYVVHARDKYLALKRLADYNPEIFGIVFCRTRMETQEIADKLIKDGYNADSLHGDLSQQQRDLVMKRYRGRSLQMLVATDVAARGIDVNDVTHVINYALPDDPEVYTHRSGRTARAGKSGVSIAIIHMKEIGKIKDIERKIGARFKREKLPGGREVCEKQLLHLVNKIHDIEVNEKEISGFLPVAFDLLKEFSKEEIIKRMLSEEFNRFLEYYRNAPDLNVEDRKHGGMQNEGKRDYNRHADSNAPLSGRFFINVGEMDGMDEEHFRQFAAGVTGLDPYEFKRLNIKNAFTFFDVEPEVAGHVFESFKNKKHKGRKLRVDPSDKSGGGGYRGGSNSGSKDSNRGEKKGKFGYKDKQSSEVNSSYASGREKGSSYKEGRKPKSGGYSRKERW